MAKADFRILVDSEEYLDQLEKLGNSRLVDEALRGLMWSLTQNAEVWPFVPGFHPLRVAMTDAAESDIGPKPSLRVFFQIRDDNYVDLFFIERDTQDDD